MLPMNDMPVSVKGHVTVVVPWICQWYAQEFHKELTEQTGQDIFDSQTDPDPNPDDSTHGRTSHTSYNNTHHIDHTQHTQYTEQSEQSVRAASCYIMEESAIRSYSDEDAHSTAIHALMSTNMCSKRRGVLNMFRKLVPYTRYVCG